MKTTTRRRSNGAAALSACALVLFAVCLAQPEAARAQWTTPNASGNINSTNTGNVGVGTTTPNQKLHVVGSVNAEGGLCLQGDCRFTWASVAGTPSQWSNGIGGSNIFYFNNVGIGTNFLQQKLNVQGMIGLHPQAWAQPTVRGMFVYHGGTSGKIDVFNYPSGTADPFSISAGNLDFSTYIGTTPQTRMSIAGGGNVGIGTTTPESLLNLVGTDATFTFGAAGATDSSAFRIGVAASGANTNSGNGRGLLIRAGDSNNAAGKSGGHLTLNPGAPVSPATTYGNVLMATAGGNVGVGTSSPSTRLDVAGQIRSSVGGFVFPDGTTQTTAANGAAGVTSVTAGNGLTGGGTGGALTLHVGAGTGLTAGADTVSVNYGAAPGTAVQGNTSITVAPGNGMSGGGPLTLGSGGTVTLHNNDRGSAQFIFKGIANAAGAVQFSAGRNDDALLFEGVNGTSVSFDSAAKKITIGGGGTSGWTDGGTTVSVTNTAARVGIGAAPSATDKLHVQGDMKVTGTLRGGIIEAQYQDVAEWVPSTQQLAAGTVVVLDTEKTNHVLASGQAYDARVAGVVSAQPGLLLGSGGAGKLMVATTGRVRVKVDATHAPVQIGDLLVTSDVAGTAMKSEPIVVGGRRLHAPGTIIGKALEPLAQGTGEILVLLSLQ